MRQLIIICLAIFSLILPNTTYAQEKNTELADNYFNCQQYQKALRQYQKAFNKNRIWHRGDNYAYFYLLFQIAESKNNLNDTDCIRDYLKLTNKYYSLEWSDKFKINKFVLLFVAESEKNLKNYRAAEDNYKQAAINIDTIPDFFKFGYAFCSLKQNRFGQALMLLNELKDSKKFEPQFSQYINNCKIELAKSLSKSILINDTLILKMNYRGCFGGSRYNYAIIKHASDYQVISYKSYRPYEHKNQEIERIQTISDSSYNMIINFENELRNYNQYTAQWSCTSSADFIIESKNEYFKIEITDCAIGVGYEIKNLLNKK